MLSNRPGVVQPNYTRLLLSGILLLSSSAFADPTKNLFKLLATDEQKIHSLIESQRIKNKITGLSVGIFSRQGLLWAKGYGFSDVENKIPASPTSVYRVGSLSKPITATAVMRMEDNDAIDIDQPIEMYLDHFKINSRFSSSPPVTARNLITHHSGLPTNINKGLWSDANFTTVLKQLRSEFTAYPADFVHNYSNVGYSVLGCLIEEISDQDYPDYIRDTLFTPLGMHYSTFDPDTLPVNILAKGYHDGIAQELLPIRDKPAMGLYSNVLDLGRFMTMLLREGRNRRDPILTTATASEIMHRQNTSVALDFDFEMGLGFFLNRTISRHGIRTLEHGGSTMNFGAYMIVSPDANLGIVVLANSHDSRTTARNISKELFDLLLDQQVQLAKSGPDPDASKNEQYLTSPRAMATYSTRAGLITISTEKNELCACSKHKILDLVPMPNDWYGVYDNAFLSATTPPLLKLSRKIVDGENVIIIDEDGKQTRFGTVLPSQPIPEIWHRRVGGYKVINEDPGYPVTDVHLMESKNQLFLHYRMPKLTELAMEIPMIPISPTEAISIGVGQSRGETLRVTRIDNQEHLLFSGFILQPLQ